MRNYSLQKGPCNFLNSHISLWEIPFLLLLCSSSIWHYPILHRRYLSLSLSLSLSLAFPLLHPARHSGKRSGRWAVRLQAAAERRALARACGRKRGGARAGAAAARRAARALGRRWVSAARAARLGSAWSRRGSWRWRRAGRASGAGAQARWIAGAGRVEVVGRRRARELAAQGDGVRAT
jgi:hypothetical protein